MNKMKHWVGNIQRWLSRSQYLCCMYKNLNVFLNAWFYSVAFTCNVSICYHRYR